jgi:hypothetical protein
MARISANAVACAIRTDGLDVPDQDLEEASFVERCPGCFPVVVVQS